jgi:hypothetical protein
VPSTETRASVLARRALAGAAALTLGAAAVVALAGKPWSALALTASGAVAMINGLWLEGVLNKLLQPGKPRVSWGVVWVLFMRWALWVLLLLVVLALRSRVEAWVIAVGATCFLVAVTAAALRQDRRHVGGE